MTAPTGGSSPAPEGARHPPIDRWQAGRSPCTLIVLPRGEAVCPSLFRHSLGAGWPIRSAPLFADGIA